ncbi:glycerol dehydrogenase (plasmid) [Roseomonas sp. CCTCC AB2023176]|uniref:glycerol dehydrogenase n=1 Tax=Roseomonas sp. CCTCC AB2023176 TaxID=3342640 RepID=UPI0035DF5898
MIIFGSPRRYVQGPGALRAVGTEAARLGRSIGLVADAQVMDLVGSTVAAAAQEAGLHFRALPFTGEVTLPEIERLVAACRGAEPPDVIVAAGGGKGIDTGKAVSSRLGARLITLPTVASNDSSTSHIMVLYDADHRLTGVERLPANPDAVIADTAVIARAPRVLLLAGIGDTVAKRFEAEACSAAGGVNMFGGTPPRMALAIAEASWEILRADASAALDVAGGGTPTPALERVVEACLLMSGLAFESGGLSIAHAMTRGLTAVEPIAGVLHGLQVAYGVLVQVALDRSRGDELADLLSFYAEVGLPRSLGDLGMPDPGGNVLSAIAGPTIAAPHTRNFGRVLAEADLVTAMSHLEDIAAVQEGRRAMEIAAT